jgi:hypothetical protein
MPDGTEVAVRRLSLNSRQGKREFVKGVKSIMDLNHRNVVRLVGCCYTNTRLLAYEFVENGTLAQSLFGNNIILLNSTSTLIFTLIQSHQTHIQSTFNQMNAYQTRAWMKCEFEMMLNEPLASMLNYSTEGNVGNDIG